MELKDYFRTVGSNPTLVLHFDTEAKVLSASQVGLIHRIGTFETADEAYAFADAFSKMLEKECETRSLVLSAHVTKTDENTTNFLNMTAFLTNPVFSDWTYCRMFLITAPMLVSSEYLNTVTTYRFYSTDDGKHAVDLIARIDLS